VNGIAASCSRCGTKSLSVEWDTDIRKHQTVCLSCGQVQGQGGVKMIDTKPEPDPETWSAKRAAIAQAKPRDPATKALEAYHGATSRYLDLADKLREADDRIRDAQARAAELETQTASARDTMDTARRDLDKSLAGLVSPSQTTAPKAPRATRSTGGTSASHSCVCAVCGSQFTAKMPTARYCSGACRAKRARLAAHSDADAMSA
jgi:hypothetical protein